MNEQVTWSSRSTYLTYQYSQYHHCFYAVVVVIKTKRKQDNSEQAREVRGPMEVMVRNTVDR